MKIIKKFQNKRFQLKELIKTTKEKDIYNVVIYYNNNNIIIIII